MLKLLNSFFAFILVMLAFKWFIPPEITNSFNEIILKILSIISILLNSVSLP